MLPASVGREGLPCEEPPPGLGPLRHDNGKSRHQGQGQRACGSVFARADERGLAHRRVSPCGSFAVAGLVALMVLVGGLTRLTDSGTFDHRVAACDGHAAAPIRRGLGGGVREIPAHPRICAREPRDEPRCEFKTIYYWEWGHRLLGRLIGVAFFDAIPRISCSPDNWIVRTAGLCAGPFFSSAVYRDLSAGSWFSPGLRSGWM